MTRNILGTINNYMLNNPAGKKLDNFLQGSEKDKPPVSGHVIGDKYIHGDVPMSNGQNANIWITGIPEGSTDGSYQPGSIAGTAGAKTVKFRYGPSPLRKNINDVAEASDLNGTSDALSQPLAKGVEKITKVLKKSQAEETDSVIITTVLHHNDGTTDTNYIKAKNESEAWKGNKAILIKKHQ